jgi:hypothetical protein
VFAYCDGLYHYRQRHYQDLDDLPLGGEITSPPLVVSSNRVFTSTHQDDTSPSQQHKTVKPSRLLSLLQIIIIIVVTSFLVTAANHRLVLTTFLTHGTVDYGAMETPSPKFPYPDRAFQYTDSEDDLDTL